LKDEDLVEYIVEITDRPLNRSHVLDTVKLVRGSEDTYSKPIKGKGKGKVKKIDHPTATDQTTLEGIYDIISKVVLAMGAAPSPAL
jgi:hypothetical protein